MIEEKRLLAARVAGQADLQDVQVFKAATELLTQPSPDVPLRYDLERDMRYGTPESRALVAEGAYELTVWQEEDDSRVDVAKVTLLIGALYGLPEDHPEYRDDELEAFAETTGQFALYPFVRQQIHDLTSRVGLPPLVLGVLRVELDGEEVDSGSGN